MKKLFFYGALLLCVLTFQACGESDDDPVKTPGPDKEQPGDDEEETKLSVWNEYADKSTNALLKNYWNLNDNVFRYYHLSAGNGDEWHYWPQAHGMDVPIDAFIRAKHTNDAEAKAKYSNYFSKWFNGIYKKNGNRYENNYFDDMEWICLTMIRLSEVSTDGAKYMDGAQLLWDAIKTGWTDQLGGGILWRGYFNPNERDSKNACSNGPAGIIAARMYQLNGGKTEDLEWAKKIYKWQKENLVESTGKVLDNKDLSGNVKDWNFTYNQGTHLGMAHELYKITGEKAYLEEAIKTASFTVNNLIDSDKLLKPEGNRDAGLFKGIFIRYFVKLILDKNLETIGGKATKTMFVNFLTRNSDTLWNAVKDNEDIIYDQSWSKAGNKSDKNSNDMPIQVSASTLIEARAYYENEIEKK